MKHETKEVRSFDVVQRELDDVNTRRDALSIKARDLSAELESMRVSSAVAGMSAEQKERLRKALA